MLLLTRLHTLCTTASSVESALASAMSAIRLVCLERKRPHFHD